MRESSKAYLRRRHDPFWNGVFVGKGIDVGSGNDPFKKEWFPNVTSVKSFDMLDGDVQHLTRYEEPESYDFLHASNVLEHMVSPLETLFVWLYVVKPGGHVVFTVPDEDLYEQGVFPSKWNPDHKWTFSLLKDSSWSPRSIKLVGLLAGLPFCRIRRVELADVGYDRSLKNVDQTVAGAEAFWEVVISKLPMERKKRTFKHSGARGDLVYGLAAVKEMGGGTVYVNRSEKPNHFVMPMDDAELDGVRSLLKKQGYVDDVVEWKGEKVDVDMDVFRSMRLDYNLLSEAQMMCFGAAHDRREPWLDPDRISPRREADIVVSRTARYHGVFDWQELSPWVDRCVFVGSPAEHEDFMSCTGMNMRRVETPTWEDLASVIRGGKLFVGNQSLAYSMAEAMKVPRVLESYPACPNCDPTGPDGHMRLTQGLIRRYVEGDGVESWQGRSRSPWDMIPFRTVRSGRQNLSVSLVVFGSGDEGRDLAFQEEAKKAGFLVVSAFGEGSFEERANRAASTADGDVICFADLSEGVTMQDVEMVSGQMLDGKTGMAGSCLSTRLRPHVSGPCFAVSRRAYEQMGLFNEAMVSGEGSMLELCLRYGKGRHGCKSASLSRWAKWDGRGKPEDDGRNAAYVEKVYGVKL